jgi:hypothetical protein
MNTATTLETNQYKTTSDFAIMSPPTHYGHYVRTLYGG